jgi:hypothetical protein
MGFILQIVWLNHSPLNLLVVLTNLASRSATRSSGSTGFKKFLFMGVCTGKNFRQKDV